MKESGILLGAVHIFLVTKRDDRFLRRLAVEQGLRVNLHLLMVGFDYLKKKCSISNYLLNHRVHCCAATALQPVKSICIT